MKQFLWFAVLLLLLSCHKIKVSPDEAGNRSACNVQNPLENLPWLRKQIADFKERTTGKEDYCGMIVYQAIYQNQTVFIIDVTSGSRIICCGCGGTAYNCKGEKVADCAWGIPAVSTDKKVIYQLIPE